MGRTGRKGRTGGPDATDGREEAGRNERERTGRSCTDGTVRGTAGRTWTDWTDGREPTWTDLICNWFLIFWALMPRSQQIKLNKNNKHKWTYWKQKNKLQTQCLNQHAFFGRWKLRFFEQGKQPEIVRTSVFWHNLYEKYVFSKN